MRCKPSGWGRPDIPFETSGVARPSAVEKDEERPSAYPLTPKQATRGPSTSSGQTDFPVRGELVEPLRLAIGPALSWKVPMLAVEGVRSEMPARRRFHCRSPRVSQGR
jgi:hypothetical protein